MSKQAKDDRPKPTTFERYLQSWECTLWFGVHDGKTLARAPLKYLQSLARMNVKGSSLHAQQLWLVQEFLKQNLAKREQKQKDGKWRFTLSKPPWKPRRKNKKRRLADRNRSK